MRLKTTLIGVLALGAAMAVAREKTTRINAATEVIAGWNQMDIALLETRIASISDVDALRTLAYFSFGASLPQKAEDIGVDAKLDRMFWATVRSLQKQGSPEAAEALRRIEQFLQDGDLLRFRELGRLAKDPQEKKEGAIQAVERGGDRTSILSLEPGVVDGNRLSLGGLSDALDEGLTINAAKDIFGKSPLVREYDEITELTYALETNDVFKNGMRITTISIRFKNGVIIDASVGFTGFYD